MLFILSDDLMVDSSHNLYSSIIRAVKYIAISVFESKHLLSGSLDVLKYYKNIFKNDGDLYCLFNNLVNNYYTTSYDFITRRLELVINCSNIYREENGFEIFQISIDEFQDTSFCQKTIILGEDLNDSTFFSVIINWYIKKSNLNIHCEYDRDGGGGVNTREKINEHLRNKKILISIIDTDRKYPNGPEGDTYRKCRNLLQCKKPTFLLIALDVQEMENLMPFNLLDNQTYHGEHAYKKSKFDLIRTNNPNLLQYFDIKKGILKADTDNDERYKEFARLCCLCDSDITDFEEYYNRLSGDKVCVYPPLSRIFNIIENDLKGNPENFILLDFQEREWHRIGQNLLNFTCARNKEALN